MATTTFFCTECDMGFEDEMDVRNHMSEMHLSYFPYKCFTCKKSGVNHETVSAELMYQHTSTVHEGIEPVTYHYAGHKFDVTLSMSTFSLGTNALFKISNLR
ncbi:hypothetical protein Ddc_22955 [Ditylenchus destructor]|nr:hypothetical protein Ddc_22955 [Ditylenchus destructor]